MGIDNFNSWIKNTFTNSVKDVNYQCKYSYIYIDLNHTLHYDIRKSSNLEELRLNIFQSLNFILSNYIPTKGIIIAIDGTSCYSKVVLQKKRRLMGLNYISNIIDDLDPINLTPGTKLMNNIDNIIFDYEKEYIKNNYYSKPKFIILPSRDSGEGEIKVFNKMLELSKKNIQDTHLVIGNDADIIVLAMAAKPIYNIDVLLRCQGKLFLICIKELILQYCNKVFEHSTIKYDLNKIYKNDIRDDFVLLAIMNGNDYLPKLKYIKFDMLWKTYYEYVNGNQFLNKNYQLIIDNIFDMNNLLIFFSYVIKNLLKRYTHFNYHNYDKKNIKKYLEGLLWCLNMYNTGICPMNDFIFEGLTPAPIEVYYYLLTNNDNKIIIPQSNIKPLNNTYYPLILMPYKAKICVPKKYHKLMDNELKYLYSKEQCEKCKEEDKKLKNDPQNKKLKEKIKLHNIKKHNQRFGINDINKIIELTK